MSQADRGLRNRLREIRSRLGKSQQELSEAAGVARQTIGGIEAGTYSVSMAVALRIARALGCRVDEIFWLEAERVRDDVTRAQGAPTSGPVQLARVDGRWVAHGLTGDAAFRAEMVPADGVLGHDGAVELLDDEEALARTVLVAGCAPALSLWARSAERWLPGPRVRWAHANSAQALAMLARGEVHAAGVHFPDDNLPAVQAALGGEGVLVELGTWQEGLALAPGNPRGIQNLADLATSGGVFVNRETGAGCRYLLDAEMARQGLAPGALRGYAREARGHVEVARAIVQGEADAGVTVSSVASAYGLDFLPLRAVRYEIALRPAALSSPAIAPLLEALQHPWIRTQLERVGGYDVSRTGVVRDSA